MLKEDEQFVLETAIDILEYRPAGHAPESDLADMRRLLNGESTGRDGYVAMKAASVALASVFYIAAQNEDLTELPTISDCFRSIFSAVGSDADFLSILLPGDIWHERKRVRSRPKRPMSPKSSEPSATPRLRSTKKSTRCRRR